MKIDILIAEIGSTTTVVNAFDGIHSSNPLFIGQGFAPTTVLQGDVTIGLQMAIANLKENLRTNDLEVNETAACSSAAGGLRMSVHGLVHDMTVKAAKEAALGAGANLHLVTAGILSDFDLDRIRAIRPNIILIAGGVDYGETATALANAQKIANMQLETPVIYAGNIQNQDAIRTIFAESGQSIWLSIAPNVYPRIDRLDVVETRRIIQSVFEANIVHAPGMEKVRDIISKTITPVPGAVMTAAILLAEMLGDLITVDIGGATTDIHSVTEGNEAITRTLIAPEPIQKRTVEGDLGLYVNRDRLIEVIGKDRLKKELNWSESEWQDILDHYEVIPSARQLPLTELMTYYALSIAMKRHAGRFIQTFGTNGLTRLAEGKDLTNVKYLIATGGALTRLPNRIEIIQRYLGESDELTLKPLKSTKILIDNQYVMATLGVLSHLYPDAAKQLLKASLGL